MGQPATGQNILVLTREDKSKVVNKNKAKCFLQIPYLVNGYSSWLHSLLKTWSCQVLLLPCLSWRTIWYYRRSGVRGSPVIPLVNVKALPSSLRLFCSFFCFEGWDNTPITGTFSYFVHLSQYVCFAVMQIYWSINDGITHWIRIHEFQSRERPVCFSMFFFHVTDYCEGLKMTLYC